MKEEALRIERVTIEENGVRKLTDFSFQVFKGEIFGLIFINFLGREQLRRLLIQNIPLHYGFVYIGEKKVNSYENSDMSFNRVSIIGQETRLVEGLSIAENIFILRHGIKKRFISRKVLEQQLVNLSNEVGISLDTHKNISELSFFEQCVTELLKAYVIGSKVVVLNDLTNFLSASDHERFMTIVKRLAKTGMSFIYACSHHEDAISVSDRIAFVENGRIVKKVDSGDHVDDIVRRMVDPLSVIYPRHMIDSGENKAGLYKPETHSILEFRNVSGKALDRMSFSVGEGETVVLLGTDAELSHEIIGLLKNNRPEHQGTIVFDGKEKFDPTDICIIDQDPQRTMVFDGLSVIDNICFLIDQKQKNIWRTKRIKKSIAKELFGVFGQNIYLNSTDSLSEEALIDIVYYRIILRKPKLVVCIQPFSKADLMLRQHIISLMDKLRERGIAVLILAVGKSDSLMVSDRAILIESGHAGKEYLRENFFGISKYDYSVLGD